MPFALRLRRFHRWHALAMSLVVLMAAGSGVLHTVMARTQAPPPPAAPAGAIDATQVRLAPAEAVAALGAEAGPFSGISLRSIGGRPWYQFLAAGKPPRYVDAISGAIDAAADEAYAAEIAGRFLGGAPVARQAYLTAYDNEYIAIFRILPVHRFASDDGRGTRVYVSTMTGSVTRHTDDARQFEANVFTYLHKWAFIPGRALRDWVLVGMMVSVVLVAVSGIVLFFATARYGRTPPGGG